MADKPPLSSFLREETEAATVKVLRGKTGPKGDTGTPGKDGVDGLDGADGKDGKDGKPGQDGATGPKGDTGVGKPGIDGVDGKDGADGSPDTGKEIISKINGNKTEKIKASKIVGFDELEGLAKSANKNVQNILSLGGSRSTAIKVGGTLLGTGINTLNFVGATGTVVGDGSEANITTSGTGISLTTIGTSGAATLVGSTLNIPIYSAGTGTVTSVASADGSITVTNPTSTVDLAVVRAPKWTTARLLAGNSVDGSANVAFSNKFIVQGTTDTGLSAAQFLGALGTGLVKNTTTTGVLSIAVSNTDYQAVIALTTTGTSGAATFNGTTLNIPNYSSGSGGISRSVNNVTTTTAAGASASTDYVYLCTGTFTVTLPTAVGNTNLYTIKNVSSGAITVATTSAQTIDGGSTASLLVQYTSVDIISDNANWNII